jgi:hypothetical protein
MAVTVDQVVDQQLMATAAIPVQLALAILQVQPYHKVIMVVLQEA